MSNTSSFNMVFHSGPEESRGFESTGRQCAGGGETRPFCFPSCNWRRINKKASEVQESRRAERLL